MTFLGEIIKYLIIKFIPFICFGVVILQVIGKIMQLGDMVNHHTLGMRVIIAFAALYFILTSIILPVLKLLKSNIYEDDEESK